MARDPFVEEYRKGMAAARRTKPKKGGKLSLEVPGAKRRVERTDAEIQQAMAVRNAPARGTGSLKAGYDPLTDRAIRAVGGLFGNDQLERNLRGIDEYLIGGAAAEQSAFNIGRGEGTGWDAANIALSTPLAGLVDKPLRVAGRAVAPLARGVANTRVGRALTEARPLVDEDDMAAAFAARPVAQRRITNQRPVVRGLPAPEQRLGLPAPGPGLPEWAAKPRGGQWWPADRGPLQPLNPANAVKEAAYLGERFSSDPRDKAFVEWFDKALPRYLQNDFATPDDPLRALADQGYIPGVQNAMQWSGLAKQDVVPYPLQKLLFDEKAAATREQALAEMPWLNKLPQTDTIYGVWPREGTQNVYGHVVDEMRNALRAEALGLPADLAVRPESLGRMSFPQAVERVGRINQWRAKQAEQAQLSALNSPAVQMFKEYPDDPRGLRWVELRAPERPKPPAEWGWTENAPGEYIAPDGRVYREDPKHWGYQAPDDYWHHPATQGGSLDPVRSPLQEALKYEGDVMGHCVGGYCDDVLQGRSRIFSLRDAKGEPHVTIETAPPRSVPANRTEWQRANIGPDYPDIHRAFQAYTELPYSRVTQLPGTKGFGDFVNAEMPELAQRYPQFFSANEDIVQIKGKQNSAPKEYYLPFVQDFVKGGQWGEIGDLANTGLVKLPDGRFITKQQWVEGLSAVESPWRNPGQYDERYLDHLSSAEWQHMAPYFEGYARGGRVSSLAAKPCSCDKSLAVR